MPTFTFDFALNSAVVAKASDAIVSGVVKQIDVICDLNEDNEVVNNIRYWIVYDNDVNTSHPHDAIDVYANLESALSAIYEVSFG